MQGPAAPRHTLAISKSSLSKNLNNYVYFSSETRGVVGRAVKIDVALFAPFLSLVDPTTFAGQQVIRAVVNLRSTAQQLDSRGHAYNAFEYLLQAGNVALRYRVGSEAGGDKGAVHITQVSSTYKGGGKSGFYAIGGIGRGVMSAEVTATKFGQATVYFNGCPASGSPRLDKAAENAQKKTKQANCLLVYSNGEVLNDLGIWKATTAGAWQRKQMVGRVREALELNAGDQKTWVAEGEGAALLLEAASQATGNSRKDLNYEKSKFANYSFKIINPVCDTAKLLSVLRQKNAKLTENTLVYEGAGRAAKVSAASHYSELTQKLGSLGSRAEFNKAITSQFKKTMGQNVGSYKAAGLAAGSATTFCDALLRAGRGLK